METLPLPIVKEISFDEFVTLLPPDCRIELTVRRQPCPERPYNSGLVDASRPGKACALIA